MCMYEFITLYEFVPEDEDGNVDFDAEMRVILVLIMATRYKERLYDVGTRNIGGVLRERILFGNLIV